MQFDAIFPWFYQCGVCGDVCYVRENRDYFSPSFLQFSVIVSPFQFSCSSNEEDYPAPGVWEGVSYIRIAESIPAAAVTYPPLVIMPCFDFTPYVVEIDARSQVKSSSETSLSSKVSSCVADKDSDCACIRSGKFYLFLLFFLTVSLVSFVPLKCSSLCIIILPGRMAMMLFCVGLVLLTRLPYGI